MIGVVSYALSTCVLSPNVPQHTRWRVNEQKHTVRLFVHSPRALSRHPARPPAFFLLPTQSTILAIVPGCWGRVDTVT